MGTVLVTGASGFVGRRLVERLAAAWDVIAISRKPVETAAIAYRGDFASFEDLRQLDGHKIDTLVHLGAEIGGTSEEAGLSVNVLGTRRLLRYLLDRGCRKFVLASSIAAAGCLTPEFMPSVLPIPARHACLARDAYGLSKYMMEEVADFFARLHPDAEFTSLRLGAVIESNDPEPGLAAIASPSEIPFLVLGFVRVEDVLAALERIIAAGIRPGSRVYNVVGPNLRTRDNVADMLRTWLGSRAVALDLGPYALAGDRAPPVYSMTEIRKDYGFEPLHSVA